ncbi:MAG: hypothetical protein FD181_3272 [Prolixibacteraceae bacterium]|nr:MAG: hypothetical protein FD181_3272 [Prolixibacteraceae bacterium]
MIHLSDEARLYILKQPDYLFNYLNFLINVYSLKSFSLVLIQQQTVICFD